jgi:predicted DNA-binding transcriptional regulator YafY
MKASRLLSIMMRLQLRGRVTAQALAEEFEVSVRTVYRDIDQLSAAGVPVYADRGPGGGFQLLDGYRTRLTGLTPEEAGTLFLAGLPGPAAELGLGEAMAAAQLKLLAALPAGWDVEAERVGQAFHLDPVDWFRRVERPQHLPTLARAVWGRTKIEVRYATGGKTPVFVLEPLGLVLKAGAWYLAARSHGRVRTYRASKVLDATASEDAFEPPKGFDLADYWTRQSAAYEESLVRTHARVRLSPRAMRSIDRLGALAADAAEAATPDKNGWREAVLPLEGLEDAARQLLLLGDGAEVLDPPELRARLGEIGAEVARLNAVHS